MQIGRGFGRRKGTAMAGISTGTLDARVDALCEEVVRLRAENERLASEVDRLQPTPPSTQKTGRDDGREDLSRRTLLRRLGGAAIAGAGLAVGASALSPEIANASAGDNLVLGASNDATTAITTLTSINTTRTLTVTNTSDTTG